MKICTWPIPNSGCDRQLSKSLALALAVSLPQAALAVENPEKNACFGAVHVHTNYSFDAFTNGVLAT